MFPGYWIVIAHNKFWLRKKKVICHFCTLPFCKGRLCQPFHKSIWSGQGVSIIWSIWLNRLRFFMTTSFLVLPEGSILFCQTTTMITIVNILNLRFMFTTLMMIMTVWWGWYQYSVQSPAVQNVTKLQNKDHFPPHTKHASTHYSTLSSASS